MPEPSLHQRVVATTRHLRDCIERLPAADPLKSWFMFELEPLGKSSEDPELTLRDDNARLRGLHQLDHLIQQHIVQIRNLDSVEADDAIFDSFQTVQSRVPSNVVDSTRELRFSIAPALLHEPTKEIDQFDPVSPTAKVVGVLRSADPSLRLIHEPSTLAEGERLLQQLGIIEPECRAALQVLFQSRFHAINAAIAQSAVAQIVEFAAGISPRGIQWSRMSPGTIYVESDLPRLMIHKAKLIRNTLLADCEPLRGLLHYCAVDVLDYQSLTDTLAGLDGGMPFTMVTEGLLLYFGEVEMKQFMLNMRRVLSRFPHAHWVTDLVSRQNLRELQANHPAIARAVQQVFSLTGRSVVQVNPFESDECILQWLRDYGLRVAGTIPLTSATALAQPDHPVSESRRNAIVGTRKIWHIVA